MKPRKRFTYVNMSRWRLHALTLNDISVLQGCGASFLRGDLLYPLCTQFIRIFFNNFIFSFQKIDYFWNDCLQSVGHFQVTICQPINRSLRRTTCWVLHVHRLNNVVVFHPLRWRNISLLTATNLIQRLSVHCKNLFSLCRKLYDNPFTPFHCQANLNCKVSILISTTSFVPITLWILKHNWNTFVFILDETLRLLIRIFENLYSRFSISIVYNFISAFWYCILFCWLHRYILIVGLTEFKSLYQVFSCGDIDLGQHWPRQWPVAWRHQAITWTIVDLPLIRSSDIHLCRTTLLTTLMVL